MPVSVDDVVKLLCSLSEIKGMRLNFQHSVRAFLIITAFAGIGTLFGGPPGLAVGGSVGGILAALMSRGQCQSVPDILMQLPPSEKQRLYDEFMAIVQDLDWRDVVELTAVVTGKVEVRQELAGTVAVFIKRLGAEVSYKSPQDAHRGGSRQEAKGLQIERADNKTVRVTTDVRRSASHSRDQGGRPHRTNRRLRPQPAPRGWEDQGQEEADPLGLEDVEHVVVGAAVQGQGQNLGST